jgi:aspartyl/glutamyl-tRNA(Asn/Gln) amidotransferase C subunit
MTETITLELFQHLVRLAALELSADEGEYIRQQLNNQLRAINELAAVPLDDSTSAASHGVPFPPEIIPPARADEWLYNPSPQDILAQAPHIEDGYIIVPDIPHTDLE